MHYALWAVQVLLAGLFLLAGGTKFSIAPQELTAQSSLPAGFLYFIGLAELAGALGLLLPGLLGIRPGLTPLAAAGLLLIMIGATVTTAREMGLATALLPFVTGLLTAFVAYGRWKLAPLASQRRR